MTAEPRMEELLASIRKAIHEDIGEVPASISARSSGSLQRGATREFHVSVSDAAVSAATEIQQLREKINRQRSTEPVGREQRAHMPAMVAEALPSASAEPARRSWRHREPPPPLRPTILEAEPRAHVSRPLADVEDDVQITERVSSYEPHQDWRGEAAPALPPPRDRAPQRDQMLSGEAAETVQAAFSRLADTMFSRAAGDRSLEDLTREMLRGMLKQWLDEHLPTLVERLVREEIERVARRGR